MNTQSWNVSSQWLWGIAGVVVVGAIAISSIWWLPALNRLADGAAGQAGAAHADDAHAGHDDSHPGHNDANSLEISPQARKNIQLQTSEIALSDYSRSITVPAMVSERPGQTTFHIAAPLTGVITSVNVVRGEAVTSGKLLFTLRLTHEDLVRTQTEFLQLMGQLDVERKELARLEGIGSGAIAGKVILERKYEVDKLEARLNAQRAALQLHGLNMEQVQQIVDNRDLLRQIEVHAPFLHDDDSLHNDSESDADHRHGSRPATQAPLAGVQQASAHQPVDMPSDLNSQQFVIQSLDVQSGEAVEAGQTLCVLVDYSKLFIEGRAFEHDAQQIVDAANQGHTVTAIPESNQREANPIEGLTLIYVSNEVERDSRALHFYVDLPNSIVRDATNSEGRHFLTWKHKPGQRLQLRVPVEDWQQVIVLPVDAIAEEGPETYVFVENGGHFDRRAVHVMYRDQFDAIVANDGSVFPGDTIAVTSAHQMQMALKNKAGGAVDPHAGHNH